MIFTTSYEEEIAIKSNLADSSLSLKQAAEKVFPWLAHIPWEIDATKYPQIISIKILVKDKTIVPFGGTRYGDYFLPRDSETVYPGYMRGVWIRKFLTIDRINNLKYNAVRPGSEDEKVYFNSDDLVFRLRF